MNRRLIIVVGLMVLPLALALAWFLRPSDHLETSFLRINEGMDAEEVEKILGVPWEGSFGHNIHAPLRRHWPGPGRKCIIVEYKFDRDDLHFKVAAKRYFNPTLLDRLNEWWGGYELHPDGSISKRLPGGA